MHHVLRYTTSAPTRSVLTDEQLLLPCSRHAERPDQTPPRERVSERATAAAAAAVLYAEAVSPAVRDCPFALARLNPLYETGPLKPVYQPHT